MKCLRTLLFFTIPMVFLGCSNEWELLSTKNLNDQYFLNMFRSSGGVYGSDYYKYYFTDSLTFNQFIGERDEKGYFDIELVSDELLIVKKFCDRHGEILIDSVGHNLIELKGKNNFE